MTRAADFWTMSASAYGRTKYEICNHTYAQGEGWEDEDDDEDNNDSIYAASVVAIERSAVLTRADEVLAVVPEGMMAIRVAVGRRRCHRPSLPRRRNDRLLNANHRCVRTLFSIKIIVAYFICIPPSSHV